MRPVIGGGSPGRRVFVSVGTDHHPFDRLVGWAERWADRFPEWEVHVQHGRSRAPVAGHGFAFCDHERMQELFESSDLVLCHGGPATITQARRWGHRPIVVPRDPGLGEHVDDHQQRFARRLATSGLLQLAETEDAFLAAAVVQAYLPRPRTNGEGAVPDGVFRVGRIIEDVARGGRRPRAEGTPA